MNTYLYTQAYTSQVHGLFVEPLQVHYSHSLLKTEVKQYISPKNKNIPLYNKNSVIITLKVKFYRKY